MTAEALKNLLRRHGKEIADEADADQDEKDNRSTSASDPPRDKNNNRE